MKKKQVTLEQINEFFDRPGINIAGICREIGFTHRYINKIRFEGHPISEPVSDKMIAVMKEYGYKVG